MENKDAENKAIQIGLDKLEYGLAGLTASINALRSAIHTMTTMNTNIINKAIQALKESLIANQQLSDCVKNAKAALTSEISNLNNEISNVSTVLATELQEIIKSIDNLTNSQNRGNAQSDVSNFIDGASLILEMGKVGKSNSWGGMSGESGKSTKSAGTILLPAPSSPLLLPSGDSDGGDGGNGLLNLFSDPGLLIDGIAQVTEAWDLNTQARNNNTAAGLAQIAATTDLSEVCTTSSSVAGVFGNAIAFLKTPLGATTAAITAAIAIGVLLYENWDEICAFAQTAWTYVQEKFQVFSNFLQGVFAKDWTEQFGAFGNILNAFFANVENVWNAVKMIFSGIVTFVKNVFAGDWKGAWDGIVQIFLGIWEGMQAAIKWPINGIIGVINGLVSAVVSGINGAIKALNKLKFTVPDWVPVIGGKYFGFNIGLLTAPQIPYLAKGAVLPANKPFLAMVGDQKHGTNIEAPLATIQDAVALVMNDQAAAMMAGFEAVVRAINEKNATLELDGREIWAAYNAYNRKAAVVRGGSV